MLGGGGGGNSGVGLLTSSANTCEALRCVEVTARPGEFLLVFTLLAVYVDSAGRKTRDKEIMYPGVPTAIGEQYGSYNLISSANCSRIE